MAVETINQNQVVAQIMETWPETIPVFLKYRFSCVGCSMSAFETLADAARIYCVPVEAFVKDLEEAIHSKTNEF